MSPFILLSVDKKNFVKFYENYVSLNTPYQG